MSVQVIDTIKPKNGGEFPVVEAVDVAVSSSVRLPAALAAKAEASDLAATNAAVAGKADTSITTGLQNQINNIVTPVTIDAEVQNARVGADGKSYASLKTRLDSENNTITTDLTKEKARALGEEVRIDNKVDRKVEQPIDGYGIPGKVLRSTGTGTEWATVGQPTDQQASAAISAWLDEHPEATTTVQDHSLTADKLIIGTLGYITPEMFGAVGDGETDDTAAFAAMFASPVKKIVFGENKHYMVNIGASEYLDEHGVRLVLKDGMNIDLNGSMLETDWTYTFMSYDPNSEIDAEIIGYTGAGNIYVHDGRFRGVTMTFLHNRNVKLHNLDFLDVKAKHAIQLGACDGFEVKGCRFIGNVGLERGALECINIEAADYTGQPYFPEGSTTYDLTIPRNIVIDSCEFAPNLEDENFIFMGDGVGTHYVPANYTYDENEQMIGADPLVEPFENITIRDCILHQRETAVGQSSYNILVTYWKTVYIQGNIFKGYRGIRLAAMFMPCEDVHIINNLFKDVSRPIFLKAGDVNGLDVSGNVWERAPYKYSMYDFNSRQRTPIAQGNITWTRCDGVRLVGAANTTELQIDECLRTDSLDKFTLEIGASADYTVVDINSFTTHKYVKAKTAVPFSYRGYDYKAVYDPDTYTFTIEGDISDNLLTDTGVLTKDGVTFTPNEETGAIDLSGANNKSYSVSYFFEDVTLEPGDYVLSLTGAIPGMSILIREKENPSESQRATPTTPASITVSTQTVYEVILQIAGNLDVDGIEAYCSLDEGILTPRIRMAYGFKL